MTTMGMRVKKIRKEAFHLTQEEFAQRINISRSNLGNIETDKVSLTERTIADICREFGIDEIWLKTGEGEIFQPVTQEEELAEFLADIKKSPDSDPIKRIILAFMKLPKDKQELMKEIMQQMIEDK